MLNPQRQRQQNGAVAPQQWQILVRLFFIWRYRVLMPGFLRHLRAYVNHSAAIPAILMMAHQLESVSGSGSKSVSVSGSKSIKKQSL